jgi:hypothetical protein
MTPEEWRAFIVASVVIWSAIFLVITGLLWCGTIA